MKIKIQEINEYPKIYDASCKMIDLVNSENLSVTETLSVLTTSLGAALISFKEISGDDISEMIFDNIKVMIEMDGKLKK